MKLYFASEARFVRIDGVVYYPNGFSPSLWERYLEYFDEVCIIARMSNNSDDITDIKLTIDNPRISFIDIPHFIGLGGYLKQATKIKKILRSTLSNDGVYICRLPGNVGDNVIKVLKEKGIPYACEVVGNPWDVFAKGSVNHPLRPFIRRYARNSLKKQVYNSNAALYVTNKTLQSFYPVRKQVFQVAASDVILGDNILAKVPKKHTDKECYRLISVGSLAQLYKAPDIVLKALKTINEKGVNCELVWLGDGVFKHDMEEFAKSLNLTEKVKFLGSVTSDEVTLYLQKSDVFILASRTEGLPRAIIEAMAQGLPCIGTRVGGIPELLDDNVLINKDDPDSLADLVIKILTNGSFYNEQAIRNLRESEEYRESVLTQKRKLFYQYVKKLK